MSNRRRPRQPRLSELYLVPDLADVLADPSRFACPDCNSDFGAVTHDTTQVVTMQVRHDDTCPWFRKAARR